jgi:hypothetical protein
MQGGAADIHKPKKVTVEKNERGRVRDDSREVVGFRQQKPEAI